jgi:pimeloyl-ACP methyl ester carboxylesterase
MCDGETLTFAIAPGWCTCYVTRVKESIVAHSWAAYPGAAPGNGHTLHRLLFWQELDQRRLGVGPGVLRTVSELVCDDVLRPVSYSAGGFRIFFGDDSFRAELADGSVLSGPTEGASFLLANNCMPQLALHVRVCVKRGVRQFEGAFFSPDAMHTVPFAYERHRDRWTTSLGDEFSINDEGWITEVRLPPPDITVRHSRARLPSWPAPEQHPLHDGVGERVSARRPAVTLTELEIPTRSVALGATLVGPARKVPSAAALFVGGSGRYDRNGNSAGFELGYAELTDRVAESGPVVLRFDMRGAGSTQAGNDFLAYGFSDRVDDARSALRILRSRPEVHGLPVYLIGHSEGGIVALDLACEEECAGVVLLATPGRPIDEVIQEQVCRFGERLGMSRDAIDQLAEEQADFFRFVREVPVWRPVDVPPRIYAQRRAAMWYREFLERDATTLLHELRCPVLVVQGSRDIQVRPEDARRLAGSAREAGLEVEVKLLAGCDHFLRQTEAPDDVWNDRRPISDDAIDAISVWVASEHKVLAKEHREEMEAIDGG